MTPDLAEALNKLQAFGFAFHSPATPDEIAQTEAALGVSLPPEVRDTYALCDGMELSNLVDLQEGEPYRLMRLAEVRETYDFTKEWGAFGAEFCPFWTNDNSDYLMLYVAGPLAGRATLFEHDGDRRDPAWRTWVRMVQGLAVQGVIPFSGELPPLADYPQTAPGTEVENATDLAAIETLRQRFDAPDYYDSSIAKNQAITLTPFNQTWDLLAYLNGDDWDAQAAACEVLGMRRYAPAIPYLAALATQKKRGNAPGAAIAALGRLRTPDALAAILELLDTTPPGQMDKWRIQNALELYGATIGTNGLIPTFRLPGETEFRPLVFGGRA